MKKILVTLFGLVTVMTTGCTTYTGYYTHAEYKPVEYDNQHSRAWNIANSAGIHLKDLDEKDLQIVKNKGESISDNYARSLALHGVGGFSWVSSAFLSSLLAPNTIKDSANESIIISFQPESRIRTVTDNAFQGKIQDQASRLASHDFNNAVKLALDELIQKYPTIKTEFFQNKNISTFEKDSAYSVLYLIEDRSADCYPNKEVTKENKLTACAIIGTFFQPANETSMPLPSFTGFNEKGYALVGESMAQKRSAGSSIKIKYLAFNQKKISDFQLSEKFLNKYNITAHEIARMISKYMPQGMYIYLSALEEKINGQIVKFPQMILDHGEVLYFVKPN